MKIILICSCVEPGRDGVGDYARRLAEAITRKGHQVALLALNDRFTNQLIEGFQLSDGVSIPVLRVPSATLPKNTGIVKNWIDQFNPDWLSLQYVIFGYHPKGLPFGLGRQLMAIAGNRRWHMMFHELWLGMAAEESIKLKLWGTAQRYLIKWLLQSLQPAVIHTQTKLYQQQLAKLGYSAGYLPIFSNIPVIKINAKTPVADEIKLVVFGLIHAGAAIGQLAADAAVYAAKHHTQVKLIFVGHCGSEQERWAKVWQQAGLRVEIMGSQPAEKISAVLQGATAGLSATAMAVVEKSGSFAAMRLHRLPVLNISKPWTPRGMPAQEIPTGMMPYNSGLFESFMHNRDSYNYTAADADTIAQNMLNNLAAQQ